MNPKVDAFLARTKTWRDEFEALRAVLGALPLEEALKWGRPCWTRNGKNIVLMHGFKEYCALLFFKGALLPDPENVLVTLTDTAQAQRQIRFTEAAQVHVLRETIVAYVERAIAVEEAGLKVAFRKVEEYPIPEEFQVRLDADSALAEAFGGLTPGRRKAYLLHFAGAKQSATRAARVEKNLSRILEGKGLLD